MIFSSKIILKRVLRPALESLGLDDKDVAADSATTYIRWQHGLQCGRPVKKIFIPLSEPLNEYYMYKSRRLCHGKYSSNKVEILDLETGQRSSWVDNEVGEIEGGNHSYHFALFDDYLVCMCTKK